MRLAIVSNDPSVVSFAMPGGNAVVTEVWMSVATVDLAACDRDAGTSAGTSLAAELVNDHPSFDVETGTFCGAQIALAPANANPPQAPAELVGRTIVLRGTLADGTPVVIGTALALTFQASSATSFTVGDAEGLLGAFDVAAWLSGLDLSTVTPDADGTLRIVDSTHPALLATFENNLGGALTVYRDHDRDGVLDADEHTALTNHSIASP